MSNTDANGLPPSMVTNLKNRSQGTRAKTVFIMRGVHGSGKSYISTKFMELYMEVGHASEIEIVSSDHFFIQVDGSYKYDGSRVGAAHSKCLGNFIDWTSKKVDCIIVDNVNACMWEYDNYVKLAVERGYSVHIVEMECPDDNATKFFHSRNIHFVPLKACTSVMKRWESDPRAEFAKQSIPAVVPENTKENVSPPSSNVRSPLLPSSTHSTPVVKKQNRDTRRNEWGEKSAPTRKQQRNPANNGSNFGAFSLSSHRQLFTYPENHQAPSQNVYTQRKLDSGRGNSRSRRPQPVSTLNPATEPFQFSKPVDMQPFPQMEDKIEVFPSAKMGFEMFGMGTGVGTLFSNNHQKF